MQHRQIVLNNHNFNMIEALSDQPYALNEYFAQITKASVEWDPYQPRPSVDTLNAEFQSGMGQLNAMLMMSNPWDIRYQFMANGVQSITFEDDNGDPLVTMALDQAPTLWYCTCDGWELNELASKRSDHYETLDVSGGIQFMMIAPLNTNVHYFTLTVTDHRTNTSTTYKLPPKMYLVSSCNVGTDPHRWFNWSSWLDGGRYSGPGSCMISPISLAHYGDTSYHEDYLGLAVGTPVYSQQSYVPADFCYWGWSNQINDVIINDAEYYIGNIQLPYEVNAAGINFQDYVVQEDGFVNEIDNRYSPRAASNVCGLYVFDEDTMHDVAKGVVKTRFSDWAQSMFSGDFKQCILYLNFFHGLHDQISTHIDGQSDIKAGDVFLRTDDLPTSVINSDSVDHEFVEWKTPVALHVSGHFNDYRDYLCKYQIYLPYYGFVDLMPNDVVDSDLKIYYNINIVTRAAVIIVTTSNSRTSNLETKIFNANTTVGEELPLSSDAIQSFALGMAQIVGKAFTTAVGMGTSMQAAHYANGGNLGSLESNLADKQALAAKASEAGYKGNMYTDNVKEAQRALDEAKADNLNKGMRMTAAHTLVSGIPTPDVMAPTRSNGGNSETGTMDELFPYLLITRPVNAEPADYESYVGLPSTESVTLSSCTGFTQVAAVKPETLTNAPKYLNEIIAQLQAGVYL